MNVRKERSRTDHRFVAEAITETGVTLRGESDWEPSLWEQEPLRRAAVSACRVQFKQADKLKVKVGPIRVWRETQWTETVTTEYVERTFDSEVTQ